ncbi:MAG: AAA family ATPase [Planktothrix sp.]|uniref:AAA family ATPase n=1 Tax=Planktothrix sp. TaxID=3088171 RepID=UPI0038D42655
MNQILQDLQICGFRGFQEIKLSGLGQVNLIVGNNNSGKTSLLEAIAIFCNPLDPFRWIEVSKRSFSSGRVYPAFRPDLESIKWIFEKKSDLSDSEEFYGKLVINCKGNTTIKQLEAELSDIYSIPIKNSEDDQLENDLENDEKATLENDLENDQKNEIYRKGLELKIKTNEFHQPTDLLDLLNTNNQIRIETFEFWEDERFIARGRKKPFINTNIISPAYSNLASVRLSKLILSNKESKNEILNLINFFDPDIIDIMILTPKQLGNIYIDHQKLGLTPLDIFGDGIKKTLAMALAIQSAKDGILLIDEIETSIHVSALSQVFSWLIESCFKQNIQLFVTTHSLEAVDAMITSSKNIDNIVGFQLNKIDNSVKRFYGDLLSRLRLNRGLDIR